MEDVGSEGEMDVGASAPAVVSGLSCCCSDCGCGSVCAASADDDGRLLISIGDDPRVVSG